MLNLKRIAPALLCDAPGGAPMTDGLLLRTCAVSRLRLRLLRERGGDNGHVARGWISRFACRLRRAALVEASDEACVEPCGDKFFIADDGAEERERRLDAADRVLVERAPQTSNRFGARAPPDGELRDQGIVVDRN